jgi:hypothetical protein
METKLEQIAAKARCEPKLRFTSLAHHITRDRVLKNLSQIPKRSAPGVDGQTVEAELILPPAITSLRVAKAWWALSFGRPPNEHDKKSCS